MNKLKLFAATISAACVSASYVMADDLSDYKHTLESVGLTPVLPANNVFAPGYVYKLLKNSQGQVFPSRICDTLFLTPGTTGKGALPAIDGNKKFGLSFVLKLLPGVVADKLGASLGFNVSKVKATKLSMAGMEIREVPQRTDLGPDKTVVDREVNPSCLANLSREEMSGTQFKNRVFLVVRAFTASDFNYDLNVTNGADAGEGQAKDPAAASAAKTEPKTGETKTPANSYANPATVAEKPSTGTAEKKDEAKDGQGTASKAATSASTKPAPNAGSIDVKLADQVELSAGWTYEKTGTQSFKVKQDTTKAPIFFAADVVRIKNIKDATAVGGGTAKASFDTAAPLQSDLDALVTKDPSAH